MRDAGETIEYAGDAMVDAGMRMLADASVDAGEAVKDAGGAMKDAGTAVDSGSAQAQDKSDGLPRPHWILRDKYRAPVQAEVGPLWSAGMRTSKPRFTNTHGDCVWITAMGQRAISLSYSLATGRLDGCETYAPITTWREAASSYLVAFMTSACDGAGYSVMGADHVQRVSGTHYYVDGAPTHVATYYMWNGSTCVANSPPGGRDIWSFKPIPTDVTNLLSAAPYTLELAY